MKKQMLVQWVKRYFLVNGLLFFAILLNYMAYMPNLSQLPVASWQTGVLSYGFMLSALIGQAALFALALAILPMILAQILPRWRWAIQGLAIVLASFASWFLVVDSALYHLYHYHVAGLVWQIIKAGVADQVLDLTWLEWSLAAVFGLVILAVQMLIAIRVWRYLEKGKKRLRFQVRYILLCAFACLFLSYTLVLRTTTNVSLRDVPGLVNSHVVVLEAKTIPYYETILGWMMPDRKGGLALETTGAGFFIQNAQVSQPLHYPLQPIAFKPPKKPMNIVIIALDAWRFDQMNEKVTPNIYHFSQKSLVFKNNLSGGNATRPGIFSLFYSVPPTYWTAFLHQKKPPVFIQTLLKEHYRMGIFQSASLRFPDFKDTVFRSVSHLKMETAGDSSVSRDKKITNEFVHFVSQAKKDQPFFSFLFYDTTHNYCNPPVSYPTPFKPYIKTCDRLMLNNQSNPVPYLNRYRNAIHFDDHLVGKVMAALKAKHLLKNTIVIVTADHGEEFNESHHNHWGHASDYTPWQTHTPLIVHWPSKGHHVMDYRTSHYDIVPTLMRDALGVKTPTLKYAVGYSLFKKGGRGLLIIGSYIDYAIRLPHQIIRIYPQGNYAVKTPSGRILPGAPLNIPAFKKAYALMRRYF